MTRPSEITRERILKAAERLFAERGYDATSVRAIVAKARVNQAAINYHFAGKEGLYGEVLRTAFHALTEDQLGHAEEAKAMSARRRSANLFAASCNRLRRATRLAVTCGFSTGKRRVRPRSFASLCAGSCPFMGLAIDLVRRFMPEADQRTLVLAAVWLIGQCGVFIRNREQLAELPVAVSLDESAVKQLAGLVSGWAIGGLGRLA